MPYGNFKDLTRRTGSDKILRDKAFDIAKNLVEQLKMRICLIAN